MTGTPAFFSLRAAMQSNLDAGANDRANFWVHAQAAQSRLAMTRDFRDASEEMKRLLRRIEEIDEAQQLRFSERNQPVPDSVDQGKLELQPGGKQVRVDVPRKFRKQRLARGMAIAGVVAAVVTAIVMVKKPAILIVLIRGGFGDAKSEMPQSAVRSPLAAEPKLQPPPLAASNAIDAEPAGQHRPFLTVPPQKNSLRSDQIWPIGLRTTTEVDGGMLVIKGLAAGARLSVGRPLHANSWELNASDLNSAFIIPPSGFAGTMDLTVELRLDGAVVDQQSMQVEWRGKTTSAVPEVSTVRMEPGEVTRLLTRGEALLASGEIAAARAMFKRLADNGEPRAALALAETYEQSTLDRLGARGLVPEIEMAQTWYERAKELGSVEAQRRLDLLASRSK
jgi:hypothetical protein